MTAYNGCVVESLGPPAFEFTAADIVNTPQFYTVDGTIEAEGPRGFCGTYNDNFPLQYPENNYSGCRVTSFFHDFYLRFWIYPNTFREFVLTPVYRSFTVWNAWLYDTECTDVDITREDEIVFNLDSAGLPFTILSLRIKTFNFTIPVEGSAQFTLYIVFDFGIYGSPYVTVTATRLVTFIWEPLVPMLETLNWKSSVLTGADKTHEQRMIPRPAPRQGLNYEVYLHDEQEQQVLELRLHGWQKRSWGVPVWAEWTKHSGTLAAGSTEIVIDTDGADYRDDSLVIVYQDKDTFEIALVNTVEATKLNLDDELQNTFTGDKLVMPVRFAQLAAPVAMLFAPDGHAWAQFPFVVTDNVLLTSYSAPQTHKGLTVLTKATYVPDVLDYESNAKQIVSDYGFGAFELVSDSEFNEVMQTHKFINDEKATCWEFREFLHSLYGKRTPVYSPTFKEDMVMTRTLGATGTVMYVKNIGLSLYMGANNLRNQLAFVFPDGTVVCREITAVNEHDANEETVQIETSTGIEIVPGDCEVCFLDRYRLAHDSVKIVWVERFYNECTLTFLRVQA